MKHSKQQPKKSSPRRQTVVALRSTKEERAIIHKAARAIDSTMNAFAVENAGQGPRDPQGEEVAAPRPSRSTEPRRSSRPSSFSAQRSLWGAEESSRARGRGSAVRRVAVECGPASGFGSQGGDTGERFQGS